MVNRQLEQSATWGEQMDLSEPSAAITPTLDGPVLVVLAATTRALSAREVARLSPRGSFEGVRQSLLRMTEHGLVLVEEAGNSTLYRLNREHVAAPAVELLVALRAELIRRITHAVTEWGIPPVHASLFGSAARADGDTASDIDLFVVRPRRIAEDNAAWRKQTNTLAEQIHAWSGNHVGLAEISETELPRVARTAAGRNIRTDGIPIAGKPVEKVLRGVA
jgi:predicted nucleotidyltransferase